MATIVPLHVIEARARELAVCPWPAESEAGRLFLHHFQQARVQVLEGFIGDLLHPEEMGHAVQPWVRERARVLLGRPALGARKQ